MTTLQTFFAVFTEKGFSEKTFCLVITETILYTYLPQRYSKDACHKDIQRMFYMTFL